MKRILLLSLLLLSVVFTLFSVNHLDVMTTITGEFDGSKMGASVVSLDFNGDGIKDLVVLEAGWNPTGVFDASAQYGKLLFYMGGQL